MIKKIFELIKVYRFSLLIILVYEFLYMFRGYKGNILAIRNNKFRTDNIPCPYFFLEIISNFLKKKNIKSLIDLGCGSGRVLYFFNQKHNIKLFGIEYYQESYKLCNNMFSSNNNIKIINNDFLKVSISQLVADCYFLNDPLKNFNSFKFIIEKILKINKKKKIYIILVNINDKKKFLFKQFRCVKKIVYESKIRKAGLYIYTNKIIKNEKN